jgi:hypothetical protein
VAAGRPSALRFPLAHWRQWVHLPGPIDVVGPRTDGSYVVAAGGRLWLLRPSGSLVAFAPRYGSSPAAEAYIALSPGGCFGRDTVYVLALGPFHGVAAVDTRGHVRRFAAVAAPGLEDGIAFRGGRLLVTISTGSVTTVDAVGCHGAVRTVTAKAPHLEGGMVVAPRGFGKFGGDLIAPDELSGRIYAITPGGRVLLVADSGLPHGGDIGVESEAFVPAEPSGFMLVADRFTPGNPHPGDDVLLRLGVGALLRAGARAGDLLAVSEGGAATVAVHCGSAGCVARRVADGPADAHIEGHVAVLG